MTPLQYAPLMEAIERLQAYVCSLDAKIDALAEALTPQVATNQTLGITESQNPEIVTVFVEKNGSILWHKAGETRDSRQGIESRSIVGYLDGLQTWKTHSGRPKLRIWLNCGAERYNINSGLGKHQAFSMQFCAAILGLTSLDEPIEVRVSDNPKADSAEVREKSVYCNVFVDGQQLEIPKTVKEIPEEVVEQAIAHLEQLQSGDTQETAQNPLIHQVDCQGNKERIASVIRYFGIESLDWGKAQQWVKETRQLPGFSQMTPINCTVMIEGLMIAWAIRNGYWELDKSKNAWFQMNSMFSDEVYENEQVKFQTWKDYCIRRNQSSTKSSE